MGRSSNSKQSQSDGTIYESLVNKGFSRRDFLKFCTSITATLALPVSLTSKVAEALETSQKPILVWLEFQDCAGDTESTLRATAPTIGEVVLDILSIEYHETIMAAAGHQAEKSLMDVVANHPGKYLAVVEGAIPTKDGGVYCCIGGKSAVDIAKEVCGSAMATIANGSCAAYGGIAAAEPNPTGAVGVMDLLPGIPLINMPGCPVNVDNLIAVVVHLLTFGTLPATDKLLRPYFAYGKRIHDNCERRGHFDAGQYVRQWGDEGHRQGWCLYEMGCKGPVAFQNCPSIKFNEGTSWPIQAGHGCIACAAPRNWDDMAPIYAKVPSVAGFGIEASADKIGLGIAAAAGAAVVAHGIGRMVSGGKRPKDED